MTIRVTFLTNSDDKRNVILTLSKQTQSMLPATVIDRGDMQKMLFFSKRFCA